MASLTNIRNGIGTNLGGISSLIVYSFVPDFIEPPTAVVGVASLVEYDASMQRGADRYEIPVFVYVSRVDAQDSQETLDGYLASTGSSSIKTNIESDVTLGGSADSTRVVEAKEVGVYNVNNVDYLGVEFTVEVIA